MFPDESSTSPIPPPEPSEWLAAEVAKVKLDVVQ